MHLRLLIWWSLIRLYRQSKPFQRSFIQVCEPHSILSPAWAIPQGFTDRETLISACDLHTPFHRAFLQDHGPHLIQSCHLSKSYHGGFLHVTQRLWPFLSHSIISSLSKKCVILYQFFIWNTSCFVSATPDARLSLHYVRSLSFVPFIQLTCFTLHRFFTLIILSLLSGKRIFPWHRYT
jgi:hypothetical protein